MVLSRSVRPWRNLKALWQLWRLLRRERPAIVHTHTAMAGCLGRLAAVLSGAPGNYVYLANADNTVSVRKVTLGPSDGNNTAILSGLAVGDTVVIDGTDRLTDKAKISIAAPNAPSGAAPATPGSQPAKKGGKQSTSPAPGAGAPTTG